MTPTSPNDGENILDAVDRFFRFPLLFLSILMLSASVTIPVATAQSGTDEDSVSDEIEERLREYNAMPLEGSADDQIERIEAKERALDVLAEKYRDLGDPDDAESSAQASFESAELRRQFVVAVKELENPYPEGSDEHDRFAQQVQFSTYGQNMLAASAYESVLSAVFYEGADREWATRAFERLEVIRPDDAERWSEEMASLDSSEGPSLQERCEDQDDGEACFEIAMEARGGERDGEKFIKYLQLACQHEASPCLDLGLSYLYGVEVERDIDQAVTHFERACEGESREACYQLAILFEDGLGVDEDRERAATFFEKACPGMKREQCIREF